MRIAVGSDHAGLPLKESLAKELADAGHDVVDFGTDRPGSVDYPDYAAAVGEAVASGEAELGVCCCGTGIGVSIAANKVPGVRAALAHDVTTARLARQHNDANVLCLGARTIGPLVASEAVTAFLSASFAGGRHARRIDKIRRLEEKGSGA
ncbi:MAG: ribose 5-phosphate isomerase B [Actinomycetota bacterium]|nr:ribose 5-phosphate isomerase B [Actinomycetota bacterium]